MTTLKLCYMTENNVAIEIVNYPLLHIFVLLCYVVTDLLFLCDMEVEGQWLGCKMPDSRSREPGHESPTYDGD